MLIDAKNVDRVAHRRRRTTQALDENNLLSRGAPRSFHAQVGLASGLPERYGRNRQIYDKRLGLSVHLREKLRD